VEERLAPQTTPSETGDVRLPHRERVLLGGKLVFAAERSVDCLIRDLTETGARVRLPVNYALGAHKNLWLINISGGSAYRVNVVWKKGAELGVEFAERHDFQALTPPSMLHLRSLWLECSLR
jgi:hypothetical protein